MTLAAILRFLAWEWINIAVEFSATAWVRLPRWFLAVAVVNLASHPALMLFLGRFGCAPSVLLPAEAAVALLETALLTLVYRRRARPAALAALALLMNTASFAAGLAISL